MAYTNNPFDSYRKVNKSGNRADRQVRQTPQIPHILAWLLAFAMCYAFFFKIVLF